MALNAGFRFYTSQWEHDICLDYQGLVWLKQNVPRVLIMALTATATAAVGKVLRHFPPVATLQLGTENVSSTFGWNPAYAYIPFSSIMCIA
jgi:hypothetical protein